jgi:hypothetical protein
MTWRPITLQELTALIRVGLEEADDAVLAAWQTMRVEPIKWRCSPWGDAGGGFWVVAIRDEMATWYNDIEGGFNTGPFTTPGTIDEYSCNQDDFRQFLAGLPEAIVAEHGTGFGATAGIPAALCLPGRIARRQTTFWTLETASGQEPSTSRRSC